MFYTRVYIHDIIYLLKYNALCVFYFSTLRVKNDDDYYRTTTAVVSNLRRVIHTINPCDPVAPVRRPRGQLRRAAPQNGRVGVLGVRLLRITHLSICIHVIHYMDLYTSYYMSVCVCRANDPRARANR